MSTHETKEVGQKVKTNESWSHIRVGASLGFDMEYHNKIIKQIREERSNKEIERISNKVDNLKL